MLNPISQLKALGSPGPKNGSRGFLRPDFHS